MSSFDTRNFTRQKTPAGDFVSIAEHILPGWDISLVFVGETRAKNLNHVLRDKEYVPNVLSYSVGPKSGEIIICPSVAKRQAPDFELPSSSFLILLFIHACLHLVGLPHGTTMERRERTLLARFVPVSKTASKSNETTNRNRH